ncbi:MAG TPA: SDR family oxidoreductase [Sedimentisphaerales bacterium]|jgi:NAD(P)-dependent dehydrogenase (short-subunit alcohol dehydrogenase family)|nr:SDR family oxidoreductase [Sedimentisphaerales bacterium]HNU31594.1 SDR family oxidoreductase [Sedimentisphaerales bacterium]
MKDLETALAGRTALVTGAARRLGRAMVMALAEQGVRVVAHYHRSEQDAVTLCDEIRRAGGSAWRVQGDLADARKLEGVFRDAVAQAGPIDILINSASIFERDTLWDATEESVLLNLRIHAMAPLALARAMARQGGEGHVINLLDTRVTVYDKEHASYHISKRVLATLTRMLALELAPKIAVNAIAPGLILPPAGEDETYLERLSHCNPLHRHGGPADVVDAALFLLRSRFITGQILYIDGGYHMKGHMYD